MKMREQFLGELPQARDDDGWVESYIGSRTPAASDQWPAESAGVIVGSDLLRTIVYAILLGGLGTLLVYLSLGVAAGQGRSIFQLTAALAAFLACGAAASRRRKSLRFILALGSLCAMALLVDQLVYYRWHKQVDMLVADLQQGVESGRPALSPPMTLPPTTYWIDPDQGVLLRFEPPFLAWTYRLDSVSSLGHMLTSGWYRILSRVTRGSRLDRVARSLVHPHEVISVAVKSDERTLACQGDGQGNWSLSIESRSGAARPRLLGPGPS